ncbi:MAG: tRNA pseudouridine(55) synthase TruB [Bacteroidota bacterium]
MNWESITQIDDLVEGRILLMNKPIFWTSFDLVKKIRNQIAFKYRMVKGEKRKIKVGHAGTLDPYADGLMIVCTGKKTKVINTFQDQEKEYIFALEFGKTTPSFDLETEIDYEYPYKKIEINEIKKTLTKFEGEIDQIPPVYSAKSVKGKRAYKSAREGETIELLPQRININHFEVVDYDYPVLTLKVRCSKGTYIRSLARDIGKDLGTGAHIVGLRRTKIGDYSLDDASSIKEIVQKIKNL